MITFLTVATATTLTEAFSAGAVLGLGIFSTIKYKKAPHSKIKVK